MSLAKAWFVSFALLSCACGSGGSSGASGGAAGAGTGGAAGAGTGGAAGAGTGGAAGTDSGTSKPTVVMDTSMGKIVIELEPDEMPITTANFLSYVDEGFYSGTIIHRVIPDFVIQGGGFTSGLVKKTTKEPITLETSPDILHDYGVISMARTTNPNSATTQFFLVNAKAGAHSLDGDYAAFGRMTEGSAVLDAISGVPTTTQGMYENVPVTDVVVNSVTKQ